MLVKIYPSKDTTIVNDYNRSFRSQSLEANLGASPYLQVYKKYDHTSSSLYGDSYARSLLYFDLTKYHDVMNYYSLASSSISCSLKMYNMNHSSTVPTSYELYVHPLSRSWDEGSGIDSDRFKDVGFCSWTSASSVASWTATGSDYIESIYDIAHFDRGTENLDLDITNIWDYWHISGNFGLIVKLNVYEEYNDIDYYNKLFHSRHSDEVNHLPCIEVKVNDVVRDRRSSLVLGRSGSIYLYNIIEGSLENLSIGSSSMNVTLYDTTVSESMSFSASFTSSHVKAGVYCTDVYIPTSYTGSLLYDVWSSGSENFMTGTVHITSSLANQSMKQSDLLISFENLKDEYKSNEHVRLNFFVRNARWNLNQYYYNTTDLPVLIYPNIFYEIHDYVNNFTFVTSSNYTQCSFDSEGSYFQLPMSNFNGFYEIILKVLRNNIYETYRNDWKFRVVE